MNYAMDEFMCLRQKGTVDNYCEIFETLLRRVKLYEDISEDTVVYFFILGLKPEIGEALKPHHNVDRSLRLESAIFKAKMQEILVNLNSIKLNHVQTTRVATMDANVSDHRGISEISEVDKLEDTSGILYANSRIVDSSKAIEVSNSTFRQEDNHRIILEVETGHDITKSNDENIEDEFNDIEYQSIVKTENGVLEIQNTSTVVEEFLDERNNMLGEYEKGLLDQKLRMQEVYDSNDSIEWNTFGETVGNVGIQEWVNKTDSKENETQENEKDKKVTNSQNKVAIDDNCGSLGSDLVTRSEKNNLCLTKTCMVNASLSIKFDQMLLIESEVLKNIKAIQGVNDGRCLERKEYMMLNWKYKVLIRKFGWHRWRSKHLEFKNMMARVAFRFKNATVVTFFSAGLNLEGPEFEISRNAFETKNSKVVWNCPHKFIAYDHSVGDSGLKIGKNGPLLTKVSNMVCNYVENSPPTNTTFQVLKVLHTVVASFKFQVHRKALMMKGADLNGFKVVLHYCSSSKSLQPYVNIPQLLHPWFKGRYSDKKFRNEHMMELKKSITGMHIRLKWKFNFWKFSWHKWRYKLWKYKVGCCLLPRRPKWLYKWKFKLKLNKKVVRESGSDNSLFGGQFGQTQVHNLTTSQLTQSYKDRPNEGNFEAYVEVWNSHYWLMFHLNHVRYI